MDARDIEILQQLVEKAKQEADGHLTVMRFTTNWRVAFFTPTDRDEIAEMPTGATFREAALVALSKGI